VNRVSLIMDELVSMLNVEEGGDTVDKLHGIYIWWIKEIFDASRRMETERLERINEHLSNYERVKKMILLDEEMTLEGGQLTPSLKVKRRVVNEMYATQIEALYAEPKG